MGRKASERRLVLRIGILSSGGDAPGMNAAVRAVARTAFFRGWELADGETGIRGPRIERVPLEEVVSKEQPWTPISTRWPRLRPSCRSKLSGTGYILQIRR
jgi:hypothetical protein